MVMYRVYACVDEVVTWSELMGHIFVNPTIAISISEEKDMAQTVMDCDR